MSMNLFFTNDNDSSDLAAMNWAAITAIAPNHGMIFLDENVVNDIARLLDGQVLANGETVDAYSYEDDDVMAAYVPAFGPALLPVEVQNRVRDRLAGSVNGDDAVRLFNEILRLKLQVSFSGPEFCDAHIKGVNQIADEVEISRSSGNLYEMLSELGIIYDAKANGGEVSFAEFAAAVNNNGWRTDMPDRLDAFLACARRHNATTVAWG